MTMCPKPTRRLYSLNRIIDAVFMDRCTSHLAHDPPLAAGEGGDTDGSGCGYILDASGLTEHHLTAAGRVAVTALITARNASTQELTKLAA
jgi:hypothetical protein